MSWISGAVEGAPDEIVLRKLCASFDLPVKQVKNCGGKHKLDQKISGYHRAARFGRWFVLRDLDHDAECGPELRNRLLSVQVPKMHLRIVVREIEAWLMGDQDTFAKFFGVSKARIPHALEQLDRPKQIVLGLVRESRKRAIREDMIPRPGSGASEGPAYASRLSEFAETMWRPGVAARRCDSLDRCLRRLREWT